MVQKASSPMFIGVWRHGGCNLLLAGAYYALAELSRQLASTPQDVTPVWPPDGLAVAAVFLYGRKTLWGVFLGSFLANIRAFWNLSSWIDCLISTLAVLGIAAGTTLGTWLGVFLLRRTVGQAYPFSRVRDVIKFLLCAGLLGPVVNATVGVAMLVVAGKIPGSIYPGIWITWWISNVAGIFVITPAIVSWHDWLKMNFPGLISDRRFSLRTLERSHIAFQPRQQGLWISKWQFLEAWIIGGLLATIGAASFWGHFPLAYIVIPLLIWIAFRFGQAAATGASLGISAIAILGTVRGLGNFADSNLNRSLGLLQSFIAVTVFTTLILTAVLAEQVEAKAKLKFAYSELATINEDLENRVTQRTQELHKKNLELNQTLEMLKQTQSQIIQNEKMSSLGQLVAGMAHEINNPINFIHGNLAHIESYMKDLFDYLHLYQQHYSNPVTAIQAKAKEIDLDFLQADLPRILGSMHSGSDRIRQIILSLRNFSRLDESDFKVVDLHEGIDNTLLILKHQLKGSTNHPISVIKEYGSLPQVNCYPGALNQVFMNILLNAVDALQELRDKTQERSPRITIRTHVIDSEHVQLEFINNGPSIPRHIQQQIFDPFFTTKPIGQGTGMGLSISYQIITKKHNGTLNCVSEPHGETKFIVQIPIQQPI